MNPLVPKLEFLQEITAPTILRRAAVLSGTPFATIPAMPIEQIVQQLRVERDRLDAAIKALTGVGAASPARSSGGRKEDHVGSGP